MASGGTKSEKPSAQRLKKAREQGQFLASKGLVGAAQFVVFLILLGRLLSAWQAAFRQSLPQLVAVATAGEIGTSEWFSLLRQLAVENLSPFMQFTVILLVATLAMHLAVSKLGFSVQKLMPNFGRLNPASKLKELPGQNFKSVIESVVLLAVLGGTVNTLIQENAVALLRLPFESVATGSAQVEKSIGSLLWKAAALFIVFGAFDLVRQYRKHMSGLRMTKEDVREENKRNDGDPQMKGRIRRLRKDLLRRQMMREVPKATAVVVNPTHFAVAIRYESDSMPCPLVVAKGKNWLALRIRQVAVENQIPVIENPPLARALYSAVEVGAAVSPEFFKAIAEILAYVYRVMGRRVSNS